MKKQYCPKVVKPF